MPTNNSLELLITKVIISNNLSDLVKRQVLEEILCEAIPNQNSCNLAESINHTNEEGYTLLGNACRYDNSKVVVNWLLDQNADVEIGNSVQRQTALAIAAQHGNVDAMQALLEHGANPDSILKNCEPVELSQNKNFNNPMPYGKSPIFYAIRYGQVEAVELLAAYGSLESEKATTQPSHILSALEYTRKLLHAVHDYKETEEKTKLFGQSKYRDSKSLPKAENLIKIIAILKTSTPNTDLTQNPKSTEKCT